MHDAAVVCFYVRMQFAETGEVCIIKQTTSRFVHSFEIGCLEKTTTVLTIEGSLCRSHVVFIHACRCIKAGMRIGLHCTEAVNRNIGRQKAV